MLKTAFDSKFNHVLYYYIELTLNNKRLKYVKIVKFLMEELTSVKAF